MSRSLWASTKGYELVSAVAGDADRRGRFGARRRFVYEHALGTTISPRRLFWLTTVGLLVLPAAALGRNDASARAQARATLVQQRSHRAQGATGLAGRTSRVRLSQPGGTSSGGRIAGAQLLAPGSGEHGPDGSALVRTLQRRLAGAGYTPGPLDGRYGPRTEQAVTRFQAAYGLWVDGIVGPRTLAALASRTPVLYPGSGHQDDSEKVRVLQRRLARAGYAPGPIDGRYGSLTTRAVMRFQAANSLQVDGIAGPQTLEHLTAGSSPRQHRQSHPVRLRPSHPQRQSPARFPSNTHRAGHPGSSSSIAWLVLLAVLVLESVAIVAWRRRRGRSEPVVASRPTPSDGQPGAFAPSAAISVPSDPDPALRECGDPAAPEGDGERTIPAATVNEGVGHLVSAENAHPRAEQRGDANGAFNLGALLEQQGDVANAMAAYRRADKLGHAAAACNIGVLLEEQGDLAEAENAYRRAEQRGDANGTFNLGAVLEQQGDVANAMAAYRRADKLGHAAAACNIGVLLEEQGDLAEAENAYRRAEQRGDANGTFNLGAVLEQQGDVANAMAAYRRADKLGHAAAACNIGVLLEEQGDLAEAENAYRRAEQRGDAGGGFNLAALLEQQGEVAKAMAADRRAGERGCREEAELARGPLPDLGRNGRDDRRASAVSAAREGR